MPSLHRLAACAVALCCLASPRAFGFASEHPIDEPVSHPDTWPAPLLQIVNDTPRVGGYFVNQDDYFAFLGSAGAFQTFLETCAALKDFGPTTLHIHKGKGTFQPLQQKEPPVFCDWRLDVINQWWRAIDDKAKAKGPQYSLELHVWLEGPFDFKTIKVPAVVKTVRD